VTVRSVTWVVGGFLLGVGASAGYVVLNDPAKPLAHLGLAADPAAVHSAASDSLVADSVPPVAVDTLPSAPDTAAVLALAAELPAAVGDSTAAPDTAAAADSSDAVPAGLEREQVARIFGSMKAPAAARILAEMDDAEARLVLAALSERKAGLILGSLPPSRAAAISRAALR
jgi:hypothetical protein